MLRGSLALLAISLLLEATAMSSSIFPYAYQEEILPNGLKVLMIPMESPGLVAYYSVVRTGSRDEVEPGKSGFAHFFEHMMFRGTKKYPAADYERILTSIGASHNAYTTDDYTAYHINFAAEDLETVIDLESDRFQNLAYEKREFQTEAGAVYGEYRKSITSPYALLNEKVQDLAYDVHTYKHTTIGFEKDIKAMPEAYEYSLSFFRRFYRPDNVVLVIVGDIKPASVMTLVRKYYGGWQKGYAAPAVVPEPPQKKERSGEVAYPGRTLPILSISYKGDAFDPSNRTYVAALVLNELAFGETSDLYKKLYIREQKVEFIQGSVPMNRDVPLFEVGAMVKKAGDVDLVRDEVYGAIAAFQKTPADPRRLADAKKRSKYGFLMGLDTPNRVAGGLARFLALTGGIGAIDTLYTTIEAVTPDDIMNAARTYYVPERRTIVVLKGAQQ